MIDEFAFQLDRRDSNLKKIAAETIKSASNKQET